MFLSLFYALKDAQVPVSLKEYLMLLEAMDRHVADYDIDHFYYLARSALIKDERHLDKFDRVFAHIFKGLEAPEGPEAQALPEEWLRKMAERYLSEEEKQQIKSLGGFDTLMDTLRKRLAEQEKRHQGGSKWIGTAGTSPFGAYGYNPEGVRIGQHESRHRRAVKVWDKRDFKNLDDSAELGTRTLKIALRRLRKFARTGAQTQLDLEGTIRSTANKGYLDVQMVPERHNAVKVLLFFDVGGSMDDHIQQCEELFSACRSEFKHLEYFYFHNCVYEGVWQDNARRYDQKIPVWDILHTYGNDYKVIFVGDAAMGPYEITYEGGSVEHWNEEAGAVWLNRILATYPHAVWLNPIPKDWWGHTHSIQIIRQLMEDRMYGLTLEGIDQAIQTLNK